MPRLETVEIDIDGNLGRINAEDFNPEVHKLWKDKGKKKDEAEDEAGDENDPGEFKVKSWTELFDFVEAYEYDYDVQAAKDSGKKLKEASAEVKELL